MYQDLNQRLNLLVRAPKFFYRVQPDGSAQVLSESVIPNDSHEYWVGAKIKLKNEKEIDGVFVIKEGGAVHERIYFSINGSWKTSDNKRVPELLNLTKEEIFPIDWKYTVPVANDIYHQ